VLTPGVVSGQIVGGASTRMHATHRAIGLRRVPGRRFNSNRRGASNITLHRTAGSHSLAAAGERDRSTYWRAIPH
jgi:hypothetical protein